MQTTSGETTSLLKSALALAAMGYPVFPLRPHSKIPYAGSHGCKDATLDASKIEGWWVTQPRSNIGIATAGLLVVDVDPEGLGWLDTKPGPFPPCPTARTPRLGLHLYMRQPQGKRWSIGKDQISRSVDHRGDGGYVVAPPSVLGELAYKYAVPLVPAAELPEVPDWLATILDQIHGTDMPLFAQADGSTAEPDLPSFHRPTNGNGTHPTAGERITRGERHKALIARLGFMRRAGFSEAEMLASVRVWNVERLEPPLPDHELARQARDAASRWEAEQAATFAAEGMADRMFGDGVVPMVEFVGDDESDPAPIVSRPRLPDHLLNVPGFIGDVMRWNLETAPVPQPILALAGAIALQSVMCAQKVCDFRGNRTNVYLVCTGESGCGKNHPQTVNETAMAHAGVVERFLGSGEIASDAALARMVQDNPALLIQIDEFGRTLKAITDERASHQYGISTALLKLYSSAGSIWLSKVYSDKKNNIKVPYPCVSMVGYTVPEPLYKALTPDSMSDGLIARLVMLEADDGAVARDESYLSDPPPSVVENMRWWASYSPGGNLGMTPRMVQATDGAKDRIRGLRALVDGQPKGEAAGGAIWARAVEKAHRLALIYACSEARADGETIVSESAMSWACDLVEFTTWRMLSLAAEWLAASDFDRLQKRVIRCIKRRGGVASRTDIGRALNDVPKRLRDEVLVNMLDTHAIAVSNTGTNGTSKTSYRLIE